MKTKFEAWEHDLGVAMSDQLGIQQLRKKGLLENAKLLHVIFADTSDEASAVHNIKMGFEPYKPAGEPGNCPKCDTIFYPKSSGECPNCGPIC